MPSAVTNDQRETPDIETSSEGYARRFAGPVGAWFLARQEAAVRRMANCWPGASVLEVGGGHGQVTGALIRDGHSVTVLGSDASCRRRIQPWCERGECQFMTGNLLDLPYSGEAFDVVVSLRLLPHMEAWPRLISELARVAKYAVIVDYPTLRSLNCLTPALFSAKRSLEGNTRPYRLFRQRELLAAFERQGFALREREPQFVLPMVLHRVGKLPQASAAVERFCAGLGLRGTFGSPVIACFERTRMR